MFLNFIGQYAEFFLTLLGIIVVMTVGYLLFSRPEKVVDKPKKTNKKDRKQKEPTVKRRNEMNKDEIEEVNQDQASESEDLYDDNQEAKSSTPQDIEEEEDEEDEQIKEEVFEEQTILAEKQETEAITTEVIGVVKSPKNKKKLLEEEIVNEDEEDIEDEEDPDDHDNNYLGNEDDDDIIDDFEQVDTLIKQQKTIVKTDKKPKPKATKQPVKPVPKKVELGRYHVLYKREDNSWYIKREGSDKIVKTLETQKEAIAYATIKAINQKTSIVVHKRDGKIRKGTL